MEQTLVLACEQSHKHSNVICRCEDADGNADGEKINRVYEGPSPSLSILGVVSDSSAGLWVKAGKIPGS